MSEQVPPPEARTKLFMPGRSQADRLPKEFRFEGSEAFVRPVGEDVVLRNQPRTSIHAPVEALNAFEPGFVITRGQPLQSDQREPILASG